MADCCTEGPSCIDACERCIEECLSEPDVAAHVECIRKCRDCIDVCALATRLGARGSALARDAYLLCAKACDACADECADECAKSADKGCAACVAVCRKCAEACRRAAA